MQNFINVVKKRKILYASIFVLIISIISLRIMSTTFSLLQPVSSVEIFSSNVSYPNDEEGSWKVTKSAKWIEEGKARITVDVDTILKTENMSYKDITNIILENSKEGLIS